MTITIIVTFCVLLLIAYIFDLTSSRTKVPAVILLLLSGWAVRQATVWFDIKLPDFSPVLPVLGAIGLILIVLEGSLELELDKSRLGLIKKSAVGALAAIIALAVALAFAFSYFGGFGIKDSLTNAIPFCVISSAIAIPSARNLSTHSREFVTYESSLSDILGVLAFNFLVLNETIETIAFGHFFVQLLVIVIVSLVATIGLSFLLSKIEHHIKFGPIILLVILIYELSKIYHLPSLLFILLFGLSIGNVEKLKQFKWIGKFKLEELTKEVSKFRELVAEGAFVVRALFFLLFGYLIETYEVLDVAALPWSVSIVFCIFAFRAIQLKFSGLPLQPLLFIAPRGLITILLFLSIPAAHAISLVNKSLIIQVIILSALLMMLGLTTNKSVKTENGVSE